MFEVRIVLPWLIERALTLSAAVLGARLLRGCDGRLLRLAPLCPLGGIEDKQGGKTFDISSRSLLPCLGLRAWLGRLSLPLLARMGPTLGVGPQCGTDASLFSPFFASPLLSTCPVPKPKTQNTVRIDGHVDGANTETFALYDGPVQGRLLGRPGL